MKMAVELSGRPEVGAEERKSCELTKLIRKCRWIGAEIALDRRAKINRSNVRLSPSRCPQPHTMRPSIHRRPR
jgi:hypothetical protein